MDAVGLRPSREERGGLAEVIEQILDKGLVINADIAVSVVGVELLGIRIRAALASFETAARYGLEFPSGTNMNTQAWKEALKEKRECPNCGEEVGRDAQSDDACQWCGWKPARLKGPMGLPRQGDEFGTSKSWK